jgi:site-specific DNA-cytosine methylase
MTLVAPETSYETRLTSEIDAKKRQWCLAMMQAREAAGAGAPGCTFHDIHDLVKSAAACDTHTRCSPRCSTSSCTIAVGGWSCKTFSSLQLGSRPKNVLLEGHGTTGDTFQGLMNYLSKHPSLLVYIGENLEQVAKLAGPERDTMLDKFFEIGWSADSESLQANEFGAATSRSRAWIVALNHKQLGMSPERAQEIISNIFGIVDKLKIEPESLDSFLLDSDADEVDAYLEHTLKAQQEDGATTAQRSASSSSLAGSTSWQGDLERLLCDEGLPWSQLRAPEEVSNSPWWRTFTYRDKCNLSYQLYKHPTCWGTDVSQKAERCTFIDSKKGISLSSDRGWRFQGGRSKGLTD